MGVCEEYQLHHEQIQKQLAELDAEPDTGFDSRGWTDEPDEEEQKCDCPPDCVGPHEERRPIGGPYLWCVGCRKMCA